MKNTVMNVQIIAIIRTHMASTKAHFRYGKIYPCTKPNVMMMFPDPKMKIQTMNDLNILKQLFVPIHENILTVGFAQGSF